MGVFEHPLFHKIEKNEGGTLWRHLKKTAKKVSQSRNNLHKKIFGQGRDSNPRPSACQISKNPQKLRSRRSYISVAVCGSQLIKLIKSATSLAFKTSQEPKSAAYLRLKNSKRTSKCQVFSSTVPA